MAMHAAVVDAIPAGWIQGINPRRQMLFHSSIAKRRSGRQTGCMKSPRFSHPALLLIWFAFPGSAAEPSRHDFRASDGARLSYLEAGNPTAQALVFVPGWMCPTSIWSGQLDHFARGNHVVAPDPRAQGESDKSVADLTPERRARDVKELLDHLHAPDVTLVGWSMAVGELLGFVDQFGTTGVSAFVLVD